MGAENSVFVKIDKYKEANELVRMIKARIAEGKTVIQRINELKNKEDKEIEEWSAELEDVEKKMEFIDSTLFEPEM